MSYQLFGSLGTADFYSAHGVEVSVAFYTVHTAHIYGTIRVWRYYTMCEGSNNIIILTWGNGQFKFYYFVNYYIKDQSY